MSYINLSVIVSSEKKIVWPTKPGHFSHGRERVKKHHDEVHALLLSLGDHFSFMNQFGQK